MTGKPIKPRYNPTRPGPSTTAPPAEHQSGVPAGYTPVATPGSGPDIAWWINPEPGQAIECRLVGWRENRHPKGSRDHRSWLLVDRVVPHGGELSAVPSDHDTGEYPLLAHHVCAISETSAISALRKFAEFTDLYIEWEEKIELDGNRSYWSMKLGAREPTRQRPSYAQHGPDQSGPIAPSDDKLPF